MTRRLLGWALISAFLTTIIMTTPAAAMGPSTPEAAQSALSCDGFSAYQTAMLKAGKRWVSGMEKDGLVDRSTRSYSETDWTNYATRSNRLLKDLRAIDPPADTADWHQALIGTVQLKASFARSASMMGFDTAAEVLAQRLANATDQIATARDAATASCTDFASFQTKWEKLDGQSESN